MKEHPKKCVVGVATLFSVVRNCPSKICIIILHKTYDAFETNFLQDLVVRSDNILCKLLKEIRR